MNAEHYDTTTIIHRTALKVEQINAFEAVYEVVTAFPRAASAVLTEGHAPPFLIRISTLGSISRYRVALFAHWFRYRLFSQTYLDSFFPTRFDLVERIPERVSSRS